MAEIAVIIVNYNAADLAIEAVQSIVDRDHDGHQVSVHLVDNASPDGSAATLQAAAQTHNWGAQMTLYCEDVNHGFGRGNNVVLSALAAQVTPPDYVFLLNPDAQLKNDALAILVQFMNSHPDCAVAGTRAYNPGASNPVTAAFRFPSLTSVFSAALSFGPVARLLKNHAVAIGADLPTCEIDWVSGAATLARFHVWQDIGFFDPEFFLYYEEVELMYRTKQAGWTCWHVAEAEILHIEGASTDVRSADNEHKRRPAYWYHSWQYYFRKTHGRTYALATAGAWVIGAALNEGLARLRGTRPAAPRRFFRDFWAAGIRPLLGLPPGPL